MSEIFYTALEGVERPEALGADSCIGVIRVFSVSFGGYWRTVGKNVQNEIGNHECWGRRKAIHEVVRIVGTGRERRSLFGKKHDRLGGRYELGS
jgi:hypothetical protein